MYWWIFTDQLEKYKLFFKRKPTTCMRKDKDRAWDCGTLGVLDGSACAEKRLSACVHTLTAVRLTLQFPGHRKQLPGL